MYDIRVKVEMLILFGLLKPHLMHATGTIKLPFQMNVSNSLKLPFLTRQNQKYSTLSLSLHISRLHDPLKKTFMYSFHHLTYFIYLHDESSKPDSPQNARCYDLFTSRAYRATDYGNL